MGKKSRAFKVAVALGMVLAMTGASVLGGVLYTNHSVDNYRKRVQEIGMQEKSPVFDRKTWDTLPSPVARYFDYTFKETPKQATHVKMRMVGDFRLPLKDDFNPAVAQQVAALGEPAFVFDETITMAPLFWAHAMDAFMDGKMEMKARLESLFIVVDQKETPELNLISLRRWLLEAPLYPMALLPGGKVRWEAIDGNRARAIVSDDGLEIAMIATFREDGSLERFDSEEDGDLSTPYHGSGEHVSRSDYKEIDGMMIPMRFTIARASKGQIFPFWAGRITEIIFN